MKNSYVLSCCSPISLKSLNLTLVLLVQLKVLEILLLSFFSCHEFLLFINFLWHIVILCIDLSWLLLRVHYQLVLVVFFKIMNTKRDIIIFPSLEKVFSPLLFQHSRVSKPFIESIFIFNLLVLPQLIIFMLPELHLQIFLTFFLHFMFLAN